MRRKLWPKAPAKEGALGPDVKKISSYFIHIHSFKKPNIKIYNRAKELYCDATIFVFRFFIVYFPKKKWKLRNGPRLPTLPYPNIKKLAAMYLSPPPSSVNSEKLFSATGSIYTENRNRSSPDNEESRKKNRGFHVLMRYNE